MPEVVFSHPFSDNEGGPKLSPAAFVTPNLFPIMPCPFTRSLTLGLLLSASCCVMSPLAAEPASELEDATAATDSIEASPEQQDPRIEALLEQADQALVRGWLVAPSGRSAMDLYQQVLLIDPNDAEARKGLLAVYHAALEAAILLAHELDFEAAENLLRRAEALDPASVSLREARQRIQHQRQQHLDRAEHDTRRLIESGAHDRAEEEITDLVALGLPRERIAALQRLLADSRLYGSYQPQQVFRDPLAVSEAFGPEMVVIPAGRFQMGSPDTEAQRHANEGPRHRVNIDHGFALARTETSVADFARFIEATGLETDAERRGWSRVYEPRAGRMSRRNRINWRHDYLGRDAGPEFPVIHVSWRDAAAYAAWLAEQTGQSYRLPSEAEFEYALRAGTQTTYWWGEDSPAEAVENVTGDGDLSPTGARWNTAFARYSDGFWGPAPVASLKPNPFGLFDMGGNVMEWTEDCWHDSFVRAPADGSAWVNPGCSQRVIRGGAWSSTPAMSRSAYRIAGAEDSSDMRLGFRVARDLSRRP